VVLKATRARKTVESKKGEVASTLLPVGAQKYAGHETTIGVESVLSTHARLEICPGAGLATTATPVVFSPHTVVTVIEE